MRLEHWKHYLALENDLHTIARYVEPTATNFGTFSVELTKLFLSACSEVDVVCKILCAQECDGHAVRNMDQYRAALSNRFSKLHSIEVHAFAYDLTFRPWSTWPTANPQWWHQHNDVKHERHVYFARANLENALNAMAGLLSLLLYTHQKELSAGTLPDRPSPFLEPGGEPGHIWTSTRYVLPDFAVP